MASLHVRNVDDEFVEKLKTRAAANGRPNPSIEQS